MSLIPVPSPMDSRIGLYITDGTVTWIVDDVRDGTPVGSIRGSLYLPKGYIKANGATVNRADYPRLVKWINDNNLWTDNWDNHKGKYGKGDGNKTFQLPDLTGRTIIYHNEGYGMTVKAGLPNITGGGLTGFIWQDWTGKNGAISIAMEGDANRAVMANGNQLGTCRLTFNAANSNTVYGSSNTVQPPAINLIPLIRY